METLLNYREFKRLEADEKVDFLETFIEKYSCYEYNVTELKQLLQNIVAGEENFFLQQLALEIYSALVLRNVLSGQAFIGTLVEDVARDASPFLQITRIRLLFLHYDKSQEAFKVFELLTQHLDADVASESLYRKGLLLFLEVPQVDAIKFINKLQQSLQILRQADNVVENRIDARYYAGVCELLLAILANQHDNSDLLLDNCLRNLWNLKLHSSYDIDFELETRIGFALNLIIDIARKMNKQSFWVDFKSDLNEVFGLHHQLINLEINKEVVDMSLFGQFKKQVTLTIVSPLYQNNLTAASSRLQMLLSMELEPEFRDFLTEINDSLDSKISKKKDPTRIVAQLSRQFVNISVEVITNDIGQLPAEDEQALVALIAAYAESNMIFSFTGYPQGDEIFKRLHVSITALLPEYPKNKLNSFSILLSSIIAYVIRSMQDKKEFFPELYDSSLANGRTEHVFQESLYRNLRQSDAGSRYLYEPNQSGGGRIDITYNDGDLMYPVEVKKTPNVPTWDNIRTDYLGQAQTYVNSYEQLGIFVVFDLSPKLSSKSPINDVRELFKFQSLAGYYMLDSHYPDGVVCVIVPGNKVSPSSMSTYR